MNGKLFVLCCGFWKCYWLVKWLLVDVLFFFCWERDVFIDFSMFFSGCFYVLVGCGLNVVSVGLVFDSLCGWYIYIFVLVRSRLVICICVCWSWVCYCGGSYWW